MRVGVGAAAEAVERRRRPTFRWAWVAALVVFAVLAVAGYLVIDDSDDTSDVVARDVTETATELPAMLVFELADVPFTFGFPSTFAAAEALPPGYLAILGVDPINFIDVRLTADEELTDEDITEVIGPSLATDTTDVLGESSRVVDGETVISFEVVDNSGAEPTTSRLSFVRAGGRTWELGCQSDAAGADVIDDACDQMLATFTITE